MSVVRWLATAREVDFGTSRTWCGAALSFALFALVLAAGGALSQSGGCARCGNAAVVPEATARRRSWSRGE
jgi:hypothetical protein